MCADCQKYRQQGHNYCRMCGAMLTLGHPKISRVTGGYTTDEKFCGYCGQNRFNCACMQQSNGTPGGTSVGEDPIDNAPKKGKVTKKRKDMKK